MDVQRRCRLLLLIYKTMGILQDIQHIIIRLYFNQAIHCNRLINSDPVCWICTDIDSIINEKLHHDRSRDTRDVISIGTDNTREHMLTNFGIIYYVCCNNKELLFGGIKIRNFVCADRVTYVLTNVGDLCRISSYP